MPLEQTRRDELAQFLRSRRERLDPADFGIRPGGRRRAVGLRREEIADAAGMSTTWYVWLEQGRNVNASAHALRALGKALRLSGSEQTYLFQLARPDLDWRRGAAGNALPSANLLALLEGLSPHPAYVTNRYAQVVASNRPARILLGEFGGTDSSNTSPDPWAGNLIARLFIDPLWRERFIDWPTVARSAVAQFRLATATMTGDPVLASLIALLTASSDEFAQLWSDRELADPPIWRKTLRHRRVGEMCFDFASLQPSGRDSDFRVSVYTPADKTSRERLARLLTPDAGARTAAKAARPRRRGPSATA
jgi:transcriptional regulator with XRE-family HTH domain